MFNTKLYYFAKSLPHSLIFSLSVTFFVTFSIGLEHSILRACHWWSWPYLCQIFSLLLTLLFWVIISVVNHGTVCLIVIDLSFFGAWLSNIALRVCLHISTRLSRFCGSASIISYGSLSTSFAMASGWMSLSLWYLMCFFIRVTSWDAERCLNSTVVWYKGTGPAFVYLDLT